jgi:hypothetical protein
MAGRPLTRARRQGKVPGSGIKKGYKRKNPQELLEYIKRELRSCHLLTWPDDWEPVARMAVLAEKHFNTDPYLALAALKEVTKYIRPALQSIQLQIDDEQERKKVDLSDIGRRYDELIKRPPYGLDAAGRRLCLSPSSGQLVPETMIDEHNAKFHRDASGKWRPEHEFSTQRAIEYRPDVIEGEVEDLELLRAVPDFASISPAS